MSMNYEFERGNTVNGIILTLKELGIKYQEETTLTDVHGGRIPLLTIKFKKKVAEEYIAEVNMNTEHGICITRTDIAIYPEGKRPKLETA